MSTKERLIAIASFVLVLGIWAFVLLVVSSSSISPTRLAELPTQAKLPPPITSEVPTEPVASDYQATDPLSAVFPVPEIPHRQQAGDIVSNQLIVRFAPQTAPSERADYVAALGGTIQQEILALDTAVITVPDTLTTTNLPDSPLLLATEPDYFVSAQIDVPTSDPHYAEQWALPVINAPVAWATLPATTPTMTIAVIDSGICADHPDLQGRILPGYDFVENDSTPQDDMGHGCSVAGVIAANADNGIGIAGVAPNTAILPLRVLDEQGIGTYSDVAAAIVRATDDGAQIINLSLGGPHQSQLLTDAVDYALERDVLVIAAAGNTGTTQLLYPAAYAPVIAVGAINAQLQTSTFSSQGSGLDTLAPGEAILTLASAGDYTTVSGTSLAAPHVAGVAALEMAQGNALTLDGGIIAVGAAQQPPPTPPIVNLPPAYDDLLAKATQVGTVRVIVGLNVAYQPESQLSNAQTQAQRVTVAQAQQSVINRLAATNAELIKPSDQWIIPAVAFTVDAAALAQLANDPAVNRITEDRILRPSLDASVPHLGTQNVWNLNFDGTGTAIAIIDSGVNSQHEFLDDGKVIHEACFSTNYAPLGATSLCPSGSSSTMGVNDPGSAQPTLCAALDGCFHGTHVAGIAAGAAGSHPNAPNGMAPGAAIVAIQIFTRFPPAECDGISPCIAAFLFDQINALNHLTLINGDLETAGYDLASVNMSLGGIDRYTSACDSIDPDSSTFVANLKSMGIATIASAGNYAEINSTYVDGIEDPACLADVISVGSSSVPGDVITEWSQSAPILDLYAPGENIVSSTSGIAGYGLASGTSMSAPHVAGAWALLKQANPTATVDEILAIVKSTGVPLDDTRSGSLRTTPRIQVDEALYAMIGPQLVVNTASDIIDDGICNAVTCSLREALNLANTTTTTTERITFNIGGGGQQTIVLDGALGPLPEVTNPVFIDGASQPGYSGTPLIEIDGTNVNDPLPPRNLGLYITAGHSLVRGLVINNFSYGGIGLNEVGENLVIGNYIGTEPDGVTAAPNLYGVIICSSDNNQIGGVNTIDRNLISGNDDDGINICQLPGGVYPVADGNVIQGNIIGLDITGDAMLGNGDDGIKIEDAINTLIGGTASGAGNVISGQSVGGSGAGINIIGPVATGTTIQGNIIGPNFAGTQGMNYPGGSNYYGVLIDGASNTLVGGTTSAARNLISGNSKAIVFINSATNNVVQGNFIGTDISGTIGLPNQNQLGIELNSSANGNLIGGTEPGAGNVVSGHQFAGIFVDSDDNIIQGNFIGTDITGTIAIGNGVASGITLAGNNNFVGGTENGAGNIIAYNDSLGVAVGYPIVGVTQTGNAVLGNRIFNNLSGAVSVGLGIDLYDASSGYGLSVNDEGDLDSGSNNLQNFPVLTAVSATVNTAEISGTLNSTPNETFRVELFSNDACDPTGYGEGQYFLAGFDGVTTDASGDAAFTFETFGSFAVGTGITATATDSGNNTSEFSACLTIASVDENVLVVNNTDGGASDGTCNTHCSLQDALARAATLSGVQTIAFNIPGAAPHTIVPTVAVNASDVLIDGTTQPGYSGSPIIVLDGSLAGNGVSGISLTTNATVRGLVLHSFDGWGIEFNGVNNVIEGNYIGTDYTGTVAMGNYEGGVGAAYNNNQIGGTAPGAGNLISGNDRYGVYVGGHATQTHSITILGNKIGTNAAGTAALPNGRYGIHVRHADNIIGSPVNTTPGGPCMGGCNLISGNGWDGIYIVDNTANPGIEADDNIIQSNYIGTDIMGTVAIPNGYSGIHLYEDTSGNLIGGPNAGEGNLISGNTRYGIRSEGDNLTRNNTIQGNAIGTDVTGTAALGNQWDGVFVGDDSNDNIILDNLISGNVGNGLTFYRAERNTIQGNTVGANAAGTGALANSGYGLFFEDGYEHQIGGAGVGEGNLISGNISTGLHLDDSDDNIIEGNLIGTNVSGTAAIPNGEDGLEIVNTADRTTIGGTASGSGNLISGNARHGVRLHGSETMVLGNLIGTTLNGLNALGNAEHGVIITAYQQYVGSTDPGGANVISGNGSSGIYVDTTGGTNTEIAGNLIGTNIDGDSALGNGQHGIELSGTARVYIFDNTLSSNVLNGVLIDDASFNTIDGNLIGTDSTGTNPLGNGSHGIEVVNTSGDNTIGVTTPNIIAHNGGTGVMLADDDLVTISQNSIYANAGLGIDLNPVGVTANDEGDADGGANQLQNFPLVDDVVATLTDVSITGTLNSTANTDFRIEFFNNETCDPSGHGEGETYLGFVDVQTDASGNTPVAQAFAVALDSGTYITTTATHENGNTSEFSPCAEVILYAGQPVNFQVQVQSEIDIQIDWQDASIDETHFVLERSLSGADEWTEIASVPTNDEPGTGEDYTYHDTNFLCGNVFDYRLRAYNEPGAYYSIYTPILTADPVCPPLNPPGTFVATASAHNQVDLTWMDDNTTETAYVIEQSVNSGATWTMLFTLDEDTEAVTHDQLQCGSTRHYRARAVRDHDSAFSPYTPVGMVTTPGCPTAEPPLNVAATAMNGNTMAVNWQVTAPGEVTTFHIERSHTGSNWSEIFVAPRNVTSFNDQNLRCNTLYNYRVRSYRQADGIYSDYSNVASTTTATCPAAVINTVGLTRNGRWHFWDSNAPGSPNASFNFGPTQPGWQPISGDWDGDGIDGIGLYQNGIWLLRQASDGGPSEQQVNFGPTEPGWQPIAGDWNGNGTAGIGVYKAGRFMLRHTATSGPVEMVFSFGPTEPGWQPVAGDWNGSGNRTIGVYKDGLWLLSNSLPALADMPPITFGQPGWRPVTGDWNEDGTSTIGVFKEGVWHLRNSNSTGVSDIAYNIGAGAAGWLPLANYRGPVAPLMADINLPPVAVIDILNPGCNDPNNCTEINITAAQAADGLHEIFFDGANSSDPDADGQIVSWEWTLDLPGGAVLVLASGGDGSDGQPAADTPSPVDFPLLNMAVDVEHRVILRVVDNEGAEGETTVIFTIAAPANTLPSAQLDILNTIYLSGSRTVYAPNGSTSLPIEFTAAGSNDPDGSITNYRFIRVYPDSSTDVIYDGPLAAPDAATYFDLPLGIHEVHLELTDDDGGITVLPFEFTILELPLGTPTHTPNDLNPPVAVAKINNPTCNDPDNCTEITVPAGTTAFEVLFDGSDSYDPDANGHIVRYSWDLRLTETTFLELADGSEAQNAHLPRAARFPNVVMAVGVLHEVTLTVFDSGGSRHSTTFSFTLVEEASGSALQVEPPTATFTPSPTLMPTVVPVTATYPPSPTPTATPTAENTATGTPTPTLTPTSTSSPTHTPSPTPTATVTLAPTITPLAETTEAVTGE